MLSRDAIVKTIISAVEQQGLELNGKELLEIRTRVSTTLTAKERHRQRMNAPDYQWRKPKPRR
ncbi:hypothetical protein [Serratia fonticola]|uniref:hypothetical protein n=1 Tax=Serratia fonticola TaxID=47917 RepID=UPI0013790AB3|nr:hypothetical protein [Serratia fonticola]NCG50177.1 hypothetical protein [Serratia fonticola]